MQQLLIDVEDGSAGFEAILVYDVSRWGRFQDADESAYYEYICRRAGIEVRYCAEQFENDGSIASTIVKTVKRAMAGEYSRELSSKVLAGQARLSEMDFRQGGFAGYGLRRRISRGNAAARDQGALLICAGLPRLSAMLGRAAGSPHRRDLDPDAASAFVAERAHVQ